MQQSSTPSAPAVKTLLAVGLAAAGLALIVWLYFNGAAIDVTAERAVLIAAIWNHVGWGAALTPALIAYAAWRVFTAPPPATCMEHLSRLLLWALAAVIVFLVVTGPLTVWTYGRPMKVFDWFAIPSPTGEMPGLHSLAENAHAQVSHVTPWLAGVEAALMGWLKLRR